jgi:hypothetical protein
MIHAVPPLLWRLPSVRLRWLSRVSLVFVGRQWPTRREIVERGLLEEEHEAPGIAPRLIGLRGRAPAILPLAL